MDKFRVIIFLMLILLLGCSKHNDSGVVNSNDSTSIFMQKAESIKTPYELREVYTKKAVASLIQEKNDSLNNDRLINMACNFYLLNSWNNLKKTSNIVLEKSRQRNDYYFLGQSHRWIGIYYENVSNNDSAFYYYSKAEKFFKIINNQKSLCNIYQDKALVQYFISDYVGSELSLIKALRIAQRLELQYEKYMIYTNLGISSNEQGNKEEALSYYNKALILAKKNEKYWKDNTVALCLNNIGNNYYFSEKPKEAILIYKEALKEKNLKQESPLIYCRLIDNLAHAKLKLKQYEGIYSLHMEALRIRKRLNIFQGVSDNNLFLSDYFLELKDTLRAVYYGRKSLLISKKYHSPIGILWALKQLTKVDIKNALKYSQEYIRISDSMQQLERVTRNKFAKIAYETEEITTEKDKAIKQKWIFLSMAILLLLVGVLLFIIIHQRTKQKEMRLLQDQQKANEEIYQLLQNQQTKIDEGRQIEKKRIAQDLHDGIMNRLASTRLNLHVIAEKPSLENIKKCLPFIDGIQDIEKEIRNIAHDLNSNAFANKASFIVVVESFIEEQKRISNSKYHLEIDMSINWEQIEGFKKIHLFRILQEAIQNIEKHAKAKNVIVSILKTENQLLAEIFDDGNGFSLKRKKKGIGLQNIFSRAKCCNGRAEVKSKVNEGTTVIVRIPI